MAPSSFVAAALAVVTLAGQAQATWWDIPPCTSPFQPFVYAGCFQDAAPPSTSLSFRSDLDFSNMTVENCVAECKGNGYRYAGLEYTGECFCGQTVGGVQVNETSCNMACTGNSNQTCGGSYLLSVYQDPTFQTYDNTVISDYVPLGCWTDNAGGPRALGYLQPNTISNANLTTETCLQACKQGGYPFAGTEFAGECWCGVVIANGTQAAPDSDCNMACKGDSSETCGGSARLSLYVAQDLESLQPCGSNYTSGSTTSSATPTPTPSVSSSSSSSSLSSSLSSSSSSSSSSSTRASTSSSSSSSTSTTLVQVTSASSTSAPATTSVPTTSTAVAVTTTKAAVCTTTTVIPPTCEYSCGNWCSSPLPEWNDQTSCNTAQASCAIQIAACFKTAGWPGSMSCFDFSAWCGSVKNYCKASGSKSKSDCLSKNAPKGGSSSVTSTITIPCAATSTAKAATTTSTLCAVPTPTGICNQPSNGVWGYGPGNAVGGIDLAVVTCNNLKSDFALNPFKVYTDSDSTLCLSFGRSSAPSACSAACKAQYDQCTSTYAKGCQENQQNGKSWGFGISASASVSTSSSIFSWLSSFFGRSRRDVSYFEYTKSSEAAKRTLGWTDSYITANSKCQAQYNDCLSVNRGVTGNGKCSSWGSGW